MPYCRYCSIAKRDATLHDSHVCPHTTKAAASRAQTPRPSFTRTQPAAPGYVYVEINTDSPLGNLRALAGEAGFVGEICFDGVGEITRAPNLQRLNGREIVVIVRGHAGSAAGSITGANIRSGTLHREPWRWYVESVFPHLRDGGANPNRTSVYFFSCYVGRSLFAMSEVARKAGWDPAKYGENLGAKVAVGPLDKIATPSAANNVLVRVHSDGRDTVTYATDYFDGLVAMANPTSQAGFSEARGFFGWGNATALNAQNRASLISAIATREL